MTSAELSDGVHPGKRYKSRAWGDKCTVIYVAFPPGDQATAFVAYEYDNGAIVELGLQRFNDTMEPIND